MKYLNKINSPHDLKILNINSLKFLSSEIRKFLIDSISETGGHLASNLGVVELTVAIHYCFDCPSDKIIWDVGHQAYVHKILTGRMSRFNTLRKKGGLSGFPKGNESVYDAFDTGHSSTSISAALGYCISRDLDGKTHNVIAVIGDGSLTGGLAFEGLNNGGRLNSNLIVVLNDNQMSISENVGALSKHLNDIRSEPKYLEAKKDVNDFLRKIPYVGKKIGKTIKKAKETIRHMFVPGALFEEMGFTYFGPYDGHNLDELIQTFNKVKNIKGPVLLHVYTKKGKGYCQAEESPAKYHGVDSFCIDTGEPLKMKIWDTYSDVFGKELVKQASINKNIVGITAAMVCGTGLSKFKETFPNRTFDVGIAEGHAVTFSAALAKSGKLPVFAVYSSFLQRSYDMIVHDVCLQNLHVIFAIDRAGIVGSDGETHQGVFDIAFLSHIPNITIMAPMNKMELQQMLGFAVKMNGPVAIRYPRGSASRILKERNEALEKGKSQLINKGKRAVLISVGTMMEEAFGAFELLQEADINITLYNARFVKPLDEEMVKQLENYQFVYVCEDGVETGGFGSLIISKAKALGVDIKKYHSFSFCDTFIEQGTQSEIFSEYSMDKLSIFNKIYNDLY